MSALVYGIWKARFPIRIQKSMDAVSLLHISVMHA
jgi:hypothetical protein